MTRVLRKPPVGYEYFVTGHFRQRDHPVLHKIKELKYEDEIVISLKGMFSPVIIETAKTLKLLLQECGR